MDSPLEKVKAQADVIFLDAAGTLITLAEPVGRHYDRIARLHGLEVDETLIETAFRTEWSSRTFREPSSSGRPDDDKFWWKSLALRTLHRSSFVPDKFDGNAWFEDLYEHFSQPGVWVLYDDAERCLERMQDKVRLAVISNFDRRLRVILEQLGIIRFFEHLFISSEIGCEKPHIRIFQSAVETMNADPAKCLHVGDDARADGEGARAAGLQSLVLSRPKVTLDVL